MKQRAKRLLNDLEQEIREHIELATQENMDRGMTPEDARYAALRKFGNVTRVKEDAREVWSRLWLEQLGQDVRFALRQLRKSPAFTVVVMLTLAVGIGATTAIFSFADLLLDHPVALRHLDRLVSVDETSADGQQALLSPANFRDIQVEMGSLQNLASYHSRWHPALDSTSARQRGRRAGSWNPFCGGPTETGHEPATIACGAEYGLEQFATALSGSEPSVATVCRQTSGLLG